MLPSQDQMLFCIVNDGEIIDGAYGHAIGRTEQEAWDRALEPSQDWAISKAKDRGYKVARCAIMLINP